MFERPFFAEALEQTEAKEAMIPAVLVSPMMMLGREDMAVDIMGRDSKIESLIPECRGIQEHPRGFLLCDIGRSSRIEFPKLEFAIESCMSALALEPFRKPKPQDLRRHDTRSHRRESRLALKAMDMRGHGACSF